jgi:hypothetical protein
MRAVVEGLLLLLLLLPPPLLLLPPPPLLPPPRLPGLPRPRAGDGELPKLQSASNAVPSNGPFSDCRFGSCLTESIDCGGVESATDAGGTGTDAGGAGGFSVLGLERSSFVAVTATTAPKEHPATTPSAFTPFVPLFEGEARSGEAFALPSSSWLE